MPRNSSGVYTQPAGTTGVALQPINPDAYNGLIADLGNEITGSVPRNGSAAMLEQLTLKSVDPVLDDHAARKKYVDDKAAAATPADGSVTTAKLASHAVTPAKINLGDWANVASASTVDLGAQTSRNLVITGTTTITSFGTDGASDNVPYLLRFAGALTLTNGANLILPGGANIVTAAGDMAVVVHDDADTWRVVSYARATTAPSLSQSDWNDGTGTTEAPISPAKLAAALVALSPAKVTKEYDSGPLSITTGGTLSLAHGLGAKPKLIITSLICTTAALGYSVGDEIYLGAYQPAFNGAVSLGAALKVTSTNISVLYGNNNSVFFILDATTHGVITIANTSWNFRVRAYA